MASLKEGVESLVVDLKGELDARLKNPLLDMDNELGRELRIWCKTVSIVITKLEDLLLEDHEHVVKQLVAGRS